MRSRGELELLLTDVELVDPGIEFLPGLAAGPPRRRGRRCELGQRLRRGRPVDVTVAARPDEQPVPPPAPPPRECLQDCVRELATVARETSYVALDRDALDDYLSGVVGELVRALSAEPFSTATAYELGSDLIAAHFTGPEISGRLVKVLGTRLLPDAGSTGSRTGPGWRRCSARPPPAMPGR